jgi:hypothetical protein
MKTDLEELAYPFALLIFEKKETRDDRREHTSSKGCEVIFPSSNALF